MAPDIPRELVWRHTHVDEKGNVIFVFQATINVERFAKVALVLINEGQVFSSTVREVAARVAPDELLEQRLRLCVPPLTLRDVRYDEGS